LKAVVKAAESLPALWLIRIACCRFPEDSKTCACETPGGPEFENRIHVSLKTKKTKQASYGRLFDFWENG